MAFLGKNPGGYLWVSIDNIQNQFNQKGRGNEQETVVCDCGCFILGGCASGVTRAPSTSAEKLSAPAYSQFASVSLSMSAAAKEKALENLKFNPDELLSHVKRALDSRSLINASADNQLPKLEGVVKDMRVHSNFSAIMWGFMAGSDSIEGGIAGGQDGTRMSWLYEKSAEEP